MHSVSKTSSADALQSADRAEIAHVMMQDLVGDYDTPDQVPEWAWVEQHASFSHKDNGQAGVWEFVVNLARDLPEIPERLSATIAAARARGAAYVLFHQGT